MADKTTTLKTKTNDNVYPNVIGDNRKNAFVDSSTIKHHFYDQTHKVGFQIANETNIKIQNSLQKPAGLTKTKLVGVGTNGQENIEIGDNLTLANGKLSASGGGGGGGITLYEYTAVLLDKSNLDIKAYTKFYSSVDIGQKSKNRTSYELYEKLLPGGSGYELSLILTGYAKINTTYYALSRMTFGSSNIRLYYLDPAKGLITYNHDFRYDTTNIWSVIRNIASPRQTS